MRCFTFTAVWLLLAAATSSYARAARSLQNFSPVDGLTALFTGDGTAYSDAVDDGTGFACSYRHLADKTKQFFAAINSEQWDNGNACGKCVKAWCVDDFCTVRDTPVTVMIVDKCPECAKGDLDFSFPAYREITGRWPHRLKVSWDWTDCDEVVNGTIKMDPKDGSNGFWNAFYVSNTKVPVKSLIINGQEFQRQEFNFWSGGNIGDAPYKVELISEAGEVLSALVENIFKTVDLGEQFAGKKGN